ncbi:hypothetical protein EVAR_88808_1 [Eumeta japonica]|uniref:Uncharacterized protein n=1 Tax=Eumeta variegata TaxID=151549 RepID=A0A4C1YK40_EUMVA|nr:hypothetical protein EVAR_88808_1 [Eumeta japonica]
METDRESCLLRKARAVGGWTAGRLLAVDAWTTSSRLSLGRCWVGAVMEQSRKRAMTFINKDPLENQTTNYEQSFDDTLINAIET